MKILIIGGSGFLGSHLARILYKKKHIVSVYDSKIRNRYNKIKFIKGNISNKKKLERAISGKDVVYNFAAVSDIEESIKKPIETLRTNFFHNARVLDICKKQKIKKFVFASTIYVHSSQGSFYCVSKQSSELFIEEFGKRFNLPYTIIRFGTVYGPGSSKENGLKKIIRNAIMNKSLMYSGSNKAKRRLIHVNDAVNASIQVIHKKYNYKNVLITGNKLIKISNLLNKLGKIFKIKKKPVYIYNPNRGHYDVTPYNYKPKKDLKLYVNSKFNLKNSIEEVKQEIANEK